MGSWTSPLTLQGSHLPINGVQGWSPYTTGFTPTHQWGPRLVPLHYRVHTYPSMGSRTSPLTLQGSHLPIMGPGLVPLHYRVHTYPSMGSRTSPLTLQGSHLPIMGPGLVPLHYRVHTYPSMGSWTSPLTLQGSHLPINGVQGWSPYTTGFTPTHQWGPRLVPLHYRVHTYPSMGS